MEKEKPQVEVLVNYFKENIPGCGVTDAEIEDLRKLYPSVSYKDLNRVFHQALKQRALQPLSYMLRQLRIIRPEADPFNSQINKTRARAYGQRVETGTDWQAIYARMDAERDKKRIKYDRTHGAGSYDREQARQCQELSKNFARLGEEQYLRTHGVEKNSKPVQGYDSWSDEDKRWYDDLIAGVFELMDKDDKAREAREKRRRMNAKPTRV